MRCNHLQQMRASHPGVGAVVDACCVLSLQMIPLALCAVRAAFANSKHAVECGDADIDVLRAVSADVGVASLIRCFERHTSTAFVVCGAEGPGEGACVVCQSVAERSSMSALVSGNPGSARLALGMLKRLATFGSDAAPTAGGDGDTLLRFTNTLVLGCVLSKSFAEASQQLLSAACRVQCDLLRVCDDGSEWSVDAVLACGAMGACPASGQPLSPVRPGTGGALPSTAVRVDALCERDGASRRLVALAPSEDDEVGTVCSSIVLVMHESTLAPCGVPPLSFKLDELAAWISRVLTAPVDKCVMEEVVRRVQFPNLAGNPAQYKGSRSLEWVHGVSLDQYVVLRCLAMRCPVDAVRHSLLALVGDRLRACEHLLGRVGGGDTMYGMKVVRRDRAVNRELARCGLTVAELNFSEQYKMKTATDEFLLHDMVATLAASSACFLVVKGLETISDTLWKWCAEHTKRAPWLYFLFEDTSVAWLVSSGRRTARHCVLLSSIRMPPCLCLTRA